jgi:hypothetical protein
MTVQLRRPPGELSVPHQPSGSTHTEEIFLFALDAHNALRAGTNQATAVMAACDLIYAARLLHVRDLASLAKEIDFFALLRASQLAGTDARPADTLSVHLTAYALGTLNLLQDSQKGCGVDLLQTRDWRINTLVDPLSLLPGWPHLWSHHSWRVSHWIGGTASILKSLWTLIPERCESLGMPRVVDVLRSSDSLISEDTGCLRAYRSNLLQALFRQAYRLRHDPDAGDVGGIAHLHWVNYAEGRLPYRAAPALHARAWALMKRTPFIERAPYCLDFDVVQIVRTAADGTGFPDMVTRRAARYASDIVDFVQTRLDGSYALHKLPGALATVHECALICGREDVFGLAPKPVDIIREAFWL